MQNPKPKCEFCGRALTDPASIALRIGPECKGKQQDLLSIVDAGKNAEGYGLGDFELTARGSKLRSLERIAVKYAHGLPANLQRDLQTARQRHALRVTLLSRQNRLSLEVSL